MDTFFRPSPQSHNLSSFVTAERKAVKATHQIPGTYSGRKNPFEAESLLQQRHNTDLKNLAPSLFLFFRVLYCCEDYAFTAAWRDAEKTSWDYHKVLRLKAVLFKLCLMLLRVQYCLSLGDRGTIHLCNEHIFFSLIVYCLNPYIRVQLPIDFCPIA